MNAAWDCTCRGEETCDFPIIFGGSELHTTFEANTDAINTQSPGVADGTTDYINSFLHYERDNFNFMAYSQNCWNEMKNRADNAQKAQLILLATCETGTITFGGYEYTREGLASFVVLFDLVSCIMIMIFGWALNRA